MGTHSKGGRAKPTSLKLLEGTDRKDRSRAGEPRPAPAIPPAPKVLRGEALAEWKRITPYLATLGLLSNIDRAALAAYCQAWADFCWAVDHCRTRKVYVGRTGYEQMGSAWAAKNQAAAQMLRFAAEFGLTPAARTRIEVAAAAVPTDDQEEVAARLLG